MSTTTQVTKTKKPIWKRWWMIVIYVFVLIGIIGNIFGEDPDNEDPAAVQATESVTPSPSESEETAEPAEESPTPEETPTPTEEETPTPTPSPEPEPADPLDVIAQATGDDAAEAFLEPGESGDVLFVTFDIADNFTSGLITSGAKTATFDVLKAAQESELDFSRVFVQGRFPMSDAYGNSSNSIILNAGYDADTVEKINFDGMNRDSIWDIRDAGMVHQELKG